MDATEAQDLARAQGPDGLSEPPTGKAAARAGDQPEVPSAASEQSSDGFIPASLKRKINLLSVKLAELLEMKR